eukprot:g13163.t1
MSEPADRPRRGGGRSSTVRRGFEPYAPTAGSAAARRAAETAAKTAGGGGGGHDTTRGRALWEDDREAPRLPKGNKEWKRDRWDEDDDDRAPGAGAARGRGARGARPGSGGSGGSGGGGGESAPAVDADVPSEERYEDMSRRVEEEVVAKLARAQMMGMMLKAHREQEQAAERRRVGGSGGGGGRRDGGGASGGRQRSRAGSRGDPGAPRQVLQRPKDGDGGGGRQRSNQAAPAPAPAPAAAGAGAAAPIRGAVAVGRDVMVAGPSKARSGAGAKATASSRSSGRSTARQQAGLLKVSPEELAKSGEPPAHQPLPEDLGADPDGMGVEDAYALVGKLERQHKALLEDLRGELGLAPPTGGRSQASSSSGSAAAARDGCTGADLPGGALCGKVSRLRVALSRALGSLVRRDPAFSLRKRLPNRLWMAHYRELEVVQQQLRQLASGGGVAVGRRKQQQQALRGRLFVLIEEAERDIGDMVDEVERQVAVAEVAKTKATAPPTSNGSSGGLTATATATAAASGRNMDGTAASKTGSGGDEDNDGDADSADCAMAGSVVDSDEDGEGDVTIEERGRQLALQTFLTSLGDLSRYRGLHGSDSEGGGKAAGWARAHELYLRALRVEPSSGKVWNQLAVLASSRQDNLEAFYAYLRGLCATAPHGAGRESLLVLHEKCKARLSTLREATALDALGLEEHQARFRLYLLGACGTCLSRVDLGAFDGYLALSDRHMVSCVQLYLMRGAGDGGPAVDPGGEGGLEGTLGRAIILCVCTVSASVEAWRSRGMEGGGSWTEDGATSRAVRLCLSLAGSLAGLHRKTSRRGWERVTAAGVGVFLDWLTCRPQFGEGARGTGLEEFQHAMACIVEFANGIIRASAASASAGGDGGGRGRRGRSGINGDNTLSSAAPPSRGGGGKVEPEPDPDATLWEDEECRGLPAFTAVAERRATKAKRRAKAAAVRDADLTAIGTVATAAAVGGRGGRRRERRGDTAQPQPGRRGSARRRSRSWADDSSGSSGGGGGGGSAKPPGGVGGPAMDRWKIRVARIRQQVEFCVERGWIARGNRPGTYTLPKPPPRHATSGPAAVAREQDFGSFEQFGVPAVAAAVEGFPGGCRDATDAASPATAEASATRKGRGATGASGTLWVGEEAGGGGGGGGGGNGGRGNAARPPARQPRVPLIPPGQQREYLLTAAAAAAEAEVAAAAAAEQAAGRTPSASLSPPFRASVGGGRGGGQTAQTPAPFSPSTSTPKPTPSEQQQRLAGGAAAAAAAEVDAKTTTVARALCSLSLDETRPPQETARHPAASLLSPPGIEPGPLPPAGGAQQRYHPFVHASDSGAIHGGADHGPSGEGEGEVVAAVGTVDLRGNPLPESVLGVVLAGLDPEDGEGPHLCKYCCATLTPTAPECDACRAPAAAAAVGAADGKAAAAGVGVPTAVTVPACRWRTYYVAEDGRPYYSDGMSSVWVKPKELEQYEAAVAASAAGSAIQDGQVAATEPRAVGDASFPPAAPLATTAAVPAATEGGGEEGVTTGAAAGLETVEGGPTAGAALPAGVLAVGNLAEVMARSKPAPTAAAATAGSQRGGGGGGRAGRDAHNPATIARAGLGDGGGTAYGAAASGVGATMFGWPRGAPRSALPLVVIDVPNVAMRHGLNKKFSCKGVQMAIEYFRTAGHRVLGFLPDYYLDLKRTNGLERAKKLGVAEVKASRLPDDVQLLQRLVEDGLIVATPPQDYDDSYCIKYAMARDGYVVTNDLYRDHIKGIDGRKKADAARRWIKTRCISYTFVVDEFFPNPDFSFLPQDGGGSGGGGGGGGGRAP